MTKRPVRKLAANVEPQEKLKSKQRNEERRNYGKIKSCRSMVIFRRRRKEVYMKLGIGGATAK